MAVSALSPLEGDAVVQSPLSRSHCCEHPKRFYELCTQNIPYGYAWGPVDRRAVFLSSKQDL